MHKLVEYGNQRYRELLKSNVRHEPTCSDAANEYYNNIERYPHIFVLGCLMNKQIKAENAWLIPYRLCRDFDAFEMKRLSELSLEQITEWFMSNKSHWFKKKAAKEFYEGVQRIHNEYDDDAAKLWKDKPSSATVVCRFLQFKGIGIKIATMAANILARDYHVEMKDYYSIDISPDIQVRRVFYRLGLIPDIKDFDMTIYKARELNPEFPGVIDVACWEIGRKWCRPQNPNCEQCPLSEDCSFKASGVALKHGG